jgi:dTDP-4-amino-4,6-dideoxygalactose transaminase
MVGRPHAILFSLVYAVAIMLIINPLVWQSISFQLSVAAFVGLFFFAERFVGVIKLPLGIGENIGTTLGVLITTLPLTISTFGVTSLIAVIVNALVLPLVPIATMLGILSVFVSLVLNGLGIVLLNTIGVGPGDEVILPAFICFVVANSIIATGAIPVYADVEKDYNVSIDSLLDKVTPNTKAILVPHMFGTPVDIKSIRQKINKNIFIIEDIAHSMGGTYDSHKLGTLGDAAIVSFGMDKVISAVRGGAVITSDKDLSKKLRIAQHNLPNLPYRKVLNALFSPIIWSIATPLYNIGIGRFTLGKLFVAVNNVIGLTGRVTSEPDELSAIWPKYLPARLANPLAKIGINQLAKVGMFNEHRRKVTEVYMKALGIQFPSDHQHRVYLRFPIAVTKQSKIHNIAKKMGIQTGRWYDNVLYTKPENWGDYFYQPGSCPQTETLSSTVINLPTTINISIVNAYTLINAIKPYVASYADHTT